MHLDLRPVDRTREQEADRILTLGASQLADHRRPDGSGWITLADPEGNEFCILSTDQAGVWLHHLTTLTTVPGNCSTSSSSPALTAAEECDSGRGKKRTSHTYRCCINIRLTYWS
jgi:hypothetical protein